jgi:hypothetical protein
MALHITFEFAPLTNHSDFRFALFVGANEPVESGIVRFFEDYGVEKSEI